MKESGGIALKSVFIGVISYVLFAILVFLLVPRIFPYPYGGSELDIKLVWLNRLVWEKILNLGMLVLAGVPIGIYLGKTDKETLLAVVSTAMSYQIIGILYVITRFGFAYYSMDHVFFQTLWTSIVFCAITAFPISMILRWYRSKEVSSANVM